MGVSFKRKNLRVHITNAYSRIRVDICGDRGVDVPKNVPKMWLYVNTYDWI